MLPTPPSPPPPRASKSSRYASARTVGIALSVALALGCLALDSWLDLVRLPASSLSSSSSLGRAKKKKNATAIRHNQSSDNNASHVSGLPSSPSPDTLSNRSSDAHQEAEQEHDEHDENPSINQQDAEPSESALALAPPPPATIVCQFSGEMGNNLDKYAHCHAVGQLLLRRHHLRTHIVLRHQDHGKWVKGARDLQKCVPFFRSMDFGAANSKAFDALGEKQLALLGRNVSDVLVHRLVTSTSHLASDMVDDALRLFASVVEASRRGEPPFRNVTDTYDDNNNGTDASDIRVPFLYVSWLSAIDAYVDEFVNDFRHVFAFDTASTTNGTEPRDACCNILPYEDETVFHLRNFFVEMPRVGPELGFHEATPDQVAHVLLKHLKKGDKVAILSRFKQEHAQRYVDALETRGLQVRFVSGQTGVQDFCFLLHAQKEMVGVALSTYFVWASYLSNCTKVVAYSIDSDRRRDHFGDAYLHHQFRHPTLKDRISLPLLPYVVDPTDAPTGSPSESPTVPMSSSNRTSNGIARHWR